MIGVRLPKKDAELIDSLVKNKQFKSVSVVGRTALTEFLSKVQEQQNNAVADSADGEVKP